MYSARIWLPDGFRIGKNRQVNIVINYHEDVNYYDFLCLYVRLFVVDLSSTFRLVNTIFEFQQFFIKRIGSEIRKLKKHLFGFPDSTSKDLAE